MNYSTGEDKEESSEEQDTIAPLCTCGQFAHEEQNKTSLQSSASASTHKNKKPPTWLESSFVHLMAPRRRGHSNSNNNNNTTNNSNDHNHNPQQHGFLEEHQHVQQLLEAATSNTTTTTTTSQESVSLCGDCTDRVAAALEADTERLYIEVQAYQEAVSDSRHRAKSFEKAISKADLQETERAYEQEIGMLQQEVETREAELAHLHALYKDQVGITQQLDELETQQQQEQNTLELNSQAFDDSCRLLSKTLSTIQIEVDQLSKVQLPKSLFDLQVDERGLRYPLINQLRLAYQPKGDVPHREIQVAWSQATQLLLVLGTLLQYPSSDWKLVPLVDCAKLIYRKEIYNLSPGDCRSLMAWNALLDQVVKHARSLQSDHPPRNKPPAFHSSPTSIGNTELTRLDRMDHVGWSQVIHRMASNLLWLSERASELVALQVSTIAHSVV